MPLDALPEQATQTNLGTGIELHDIWRRMQQLLPDERDQRLMRLVFVEGYKPRDITALYPTFWPSERQVSIALYRIRRTLRADPGLAVLYGLSPDQAV
jgi:hypothetical protein